MFGKFGDMKKKAGDMKDKLANTVIEKESAGIKVSIDGTKNVKSLYIPDLYLEHTRKEELEEKLITLLNEAGEDANELMKQEMSALAGPLSGMLGL